MKTDAIIDNGR